MKVVGLTGTSGSGKTTAARMMKELGAYVLDADEMAHECILFGREAYSLILDFFGHGILENTKLDSEIDRKKLGRIVFSDKQKLEKLEEIVHYYVRKEIVENLENKEKYSDDYSFLLIDAPLIIEGDLICYCDLTILVHADYDLRMQRILARDEIEKTEVRKRFDMQRSLEEFLPFIDVAIYNNKTEDDLRSSLLAEIVKHEIL